MVPLQAFFDHVFDSACLVDILLRGLFREYVIELEVSTLNPEQLAMLEKAKEEVDWGPRQEGKVNKPAQPADEALERQKLRIRFRGTVPMARDGRIDIYLFARIGDSNATPTMFALQELYKKHGQNLNIKFHGFSIGMAT